MGPTGPEPSDWSAISPAIALAEMEHLVTAAVAGASSRVTFRQLSGPGELTEAARLIAEVFGAPEASMSVDLLTAVVFAGGFVGGAYLDGRLVGAAVAFGEVPAPGATEPPAIHSHVAAVDGSARGLRIGQRLKWYQREWALQRDIDVIHWTFDPLVRRNAVLNLNRLGAVASTYFEDFYGSIPDALNAGMESDRLLIRWELRSEPVLAALRASGGVGLESAEGGAALPPDRAGGSDRRVASIPTPVDIEAMVASDLPAAHQWRMRQRAAFGALPQGWVVTGIDPDGCYEVEQR